MPEVGARIMDLQEPERKMSTTGGTEQGTVLVLDDEKTIRKKVGSAVTDSGREVRAAPDKPGVTNLIDILAVARGTGRAEIEREFDGAGYGDFKKAVADGVVELLGAGARALRGAAARRGGARGDARGRGGEGAGDRRGDAGRRARAHGLRLARPSAQLRQPEIALETPFATSRRASSLSPMAVAELDLDLDVFAGPFDLLLAVVLREEVSLLELQLGEVVVAYVDHLEAGGRARPRGGDRVPRPDRLAAGAEVAADAAARGGRASSR